jgi:type I restriction enzyme R subunit
MVNQNPEQIARDKIDAMLQESGWHIQDKSRIDWKAGSGIAVREYPTDRGPADYVLFVQGTPVGVIEAKREEEGQHLTKVEDQSREYAGSRLKYIENEELPFVYESTGVLTRFTDYRDPKPRSRPVFTFHRPETMDQWLNEKKTLRARILDMPVLENGLLRLCQINAISNLDISLKENRPRALVQMATGSGKTYTAITAIYRLLKFADINKVLFLVDTKNLGEQAEQEFMAYVPADDNRKFTELYNIQRLSSRYIASDSQVCISTIQRIYSILKDEELDEAAEEENPAESGWRAKEPVPVVYNEKLPPESFDVIIIDECHRSIYNLWKQVLDYFDAFLIGLTATPDKRTFAFFDENIVSEYTHEDAVADGVNVGYEVYIIETEITNQGGHIDKKLAPFIETRERLSRKKRWQQLDDDVTYNAKQLDNDVVNHSQIRNIIRTYKNNLPVIFPGRKEVPKTLIFAKTDSHADDIIQIVRDEFAEGNDFCKKVTYKAQEDPKSVLSQFRNSYNPRIAVTVDMIATGTDVRPLECLLFMRDVKSRNYFEQMKGRGTRIIGQDDLKRVTPSAHSAKTHFVIVDAIGVTRSLKTDSRPLERKKATPLKDLLGAVLMGARDEDLFLSLANRLARLNKQITEKEREKISALSGGSDIRDMVKGLLNAFNPDVIEAGARELRKNDPELSEAKAEKMAQDELVNNARSVFTGELNEYIETVRRVHDQIIDSVNIDRVTRAEFDKDAVVNAESLVSEFAAYLEEYRDEIIALKIYYSQPRRIKEITSKNISELFEKIKADRPHLAPLRIWHAYEQLEKVKSKNPQNELIALVSLIRRVAGIDSSLTSFTDVVDKNFKDWIFKKHRGASPKFSDEQLHFLRIIKESIASSFHFEAEDFELAEQGAWARAYNVFGDDLGGVIEELNEVLTA